MNRNLFLIVAILLGIVATMLMGNIIIIGDKLGQLTHVYVEYTYYILLLTAAAIYLVRPIVKVHRAPEIPALKVEEHGNAQQLYAFAKRLAGNCHYIADKTLREKHRKELLESIKFHSAEPEPLRKIISKEIALRMEGSTELKVMGINNRIKEWGKTVFMVTAISQNSRFDTIAVLVMNYKLIADIVTASGFRPTKPQMFKLYVKVLTTALITYCTSQVFTDMNGVAPFDFGDSASPAEMDMDMEDADIDVEADMDVDTDGDGGSFGTSFAEALRKLQIPGIVVGSVIEGCVNAMMTLRIGYVTRAYLTEGAKALSGTKNKRRVKRQALKESFKAMPTVIMNGSSAIGKTAASLLNKLFKGEVI